MSTSNLSETFHNIWLQQSGNKRTCFFGATFDNYVQTLRQFSLYYAFLQGGVHGTSPEKNELHLHKLVSLRTQSKLVLQLPSTS
jgi:hypothetical protein